MLFEIKKMGAGKIKIENKVVEDEVVVVYDEKVTHHLWREMERLREENGKLKKEVEDLN